MDSRQPPLNRGEQLSALRRLEAKSFEGKGKTLAPCILKAVLRAVADHGDCCWASVATLAAETCLSERSIIRSLASLVELRFLSKREQPGKTTRYWIDWNHASLYQSNIGHTVTPDPQSCPTDLRGDSQSVHPCLPVSPPLTPSQSTPDSQSPKTKRNKQETKRKQTLSSKPSFDQQAFLDSWIRDWNSWHKQGIVNANVNVKPSQALRNASKRVSASKELQNLLSDSGAILEALRKSDFCRGGWFTLVKLLGGKNKDSEFIAQKLLDGGYMGSQAAKPRTAATGPGQKFDSGRTGNVKF